MGWDVPIEVPVFRTLTEAVAAGTLRTHASAEGLAPFVVEEDLPDGVAAIFERTEADQCVFFDRHSRLCIVHRELGEPALPVTCRVFPRLALRDRRGTFITLSHFCPTAASMLFDDVPLDIVTAPPAFPPADYDGLTVTPDDLPPLLHPSMLMDLEGYSAWERHMVARCRDVDRPPESVLATLARDAHLLRTWKPGTCTLVEAVALLPAHVVPGSAPRDLGESWRLYDGVMAAVPEDLRPARDDRGVDESFAQYVVAAWDRFRAPLNRFIAAKAFASWTAYQGRGIATVVRGLEAAMAVLRVEAARQCRDARRELDRDLLLEAFRGADFIWNHLTVGEDLAAGWSSAEERQPA